jgi:hypothetical protein
MTRVRRTGRITIADLEDLSRARLGRHLGLVRDQASRACHRSAMARRHPYLLAVGSCVVSAVAVWLLASARRRPLPPAAAPKPETDPTLAVLIGDAVGAICRLWARFRQ